jgi:glycosyltransferase involved in cell wall biosynthesis
MSSLNPRDENDIVTNKCSAYAAYNPYPRKNSPLMEKLKSFCLDTLGISFEYKLGRILLSEKEYVSQLDSHEIYLCTSLQEGGPIPAMDAMVRGAVVLSTPVGQMPEIITNGENGFLCSSEDDFKRYLRLLADDHNQLQRLRLASRRKIVLLRNREEIQKNMLRFLQQLRTT